MYHIVYLTTNLINNKIYVGVRSHQNPDKDSYLGSGIKLALAIKKYGRTNFKREVLHYCLEASHAYELESKIVDKWFINRKDTYNCCVGGKGGSFLDLKGKSWDELYGKDKSLKMKEHISKYRTGRPNGRTLETSKRIGRIVSEKLSGKTYEEIHGIEKAKELRRKKVEQGLNNNPFKGKQHTDEFKNASSDRMKAKVGYFKNKRLVLIEVHTPDNTSFTFLYGLYKLSEYINIPKSGIRKCINNVKDDYKGFRFYVISNLISLNSQPTSI
jgi:group I intron endonuclease